MSIAKYIKEYLLEACKTGVKEEELTDKQKQLDLDDDGEIDSEDLANLRKGKTDSDIEEEVEQDEEKEEPVTEKKKSKKKKVSEEMDEISDEEKPLPVSEKCKKKVNEVTIVLPSDEGLVALSAISKRPNMMMNSKVKQELEKAGLVKSGKITQVGKDLLKTPDAEEQLSTIGS